jgi:hypothetical protein
LTLNNISGTAGSPITFTSYGVGPKPIIDGCPNGGCTTRGKKGGPSIAACVAADQSTGTGNNVGYITIDGFECRNTTEYGINFRVGNTATPGIVIQNNNIHNTGAGAFIGNTSHPGALDDGHYG